jgi:sugar lactone lactonase YvrE
VGQLDQGRLVGRPGTLRAELLLDARADLGEGPIWHADRAAVSWVELYEGRVNWLDLDGSAGRAVEAGRRVGAAVPAAGGGLALATDEGFAHVDAGGAYELVARVDGPSGDWFMNDGRCDAAGRFWAGTVGVRPDGLAADGVGSLYCLDSHGALRRVLDGLSLSNGLDWSPDGRTFYFVDSRARGIDAFDFDVEQGELGRRRRLVELEFPPEVAFVDGICADADGCLWAAVWGTGEVRRYSPAGDVDRTIELPVSQPTSCVFAGDALDVLVITSARRGLPEDELERQPHAGSVFCCRPGASGLPANEWRRATPERAPCT